MENQFGLFMDIKFVILFVAVIVVFLLNRIYVYSEEKRKKQLKEEIVLTDKEIIALLDDPLTGEKVKLSKTLSKSDEDFRIDYEGNQRTSQKVLDNYEEDSERELLLIKNYLLDNNFIFKKLSETEVHTLEKAKILSGFVDWKYCNSYHKENLSVFITDVLSKNHKSKYGGYIKDSNLFFWIKDFNFSGHYGFYKKNLAENLIDFFEPDMLEIKEDYHTIIFRKSGMERELTKLLKQLEFDGDMEIEVLNSNIFIRILNFASLENLISFYNTLSYLNK